MLWIHRHYLHLNLVPNLLSAVSMSILLFCSTPLGLVCRCIAYFFPTRSVSGYALGHSFLQGDPVVFRRGDWGPQPPPTPDSPFSKITVFCRTPNIIGFSPFLFEVLSSHKISLCFNPISHHVNTKQAPCTGMQYPCFRAYHTYANNCKGSCGPRL